jgi:prepilin-type N-terminal cleavage/methylation domain-containing protein
MDPGILMRNDSLRSGFSLAEIMVALVILSVIVMGLASTTTTFLHETSLDNVRVRASTAADTRIAEIQGWPDYAALSSFNETRSNFPDVGYTRTTTIVRDTTPATGCNSPPFPQCPNSDITRATVTVTGPALTTPVTRTIAITSF